jgi:hypothetical protein
MKIMKNLVCRFAFVLSLCGASEITACSMSHKMDTAYPNPSFTELLNTRSPSTGSTEYGSSSSLTNMQAPYQAVPLEKYYTFCPPIANSAPHCEDVSGSYPMPAQLALSADKDYDSRLLGALAYSVPPQMTVDESSIVEIRITKSTILSIQKLIGQDMPTEPRYAVIKVATDMRATLTGDDLEVQRVTPADPTLDWTKIGAAKNDYGDWRWKVTPRSPGRKEIRLDAYARDSRDGDITVRHVYSDKIDVNANPTEIWSNFGQWAVGHITWIVSAILIPLGGWLLAKLRLRHS